MVDIDVDQPAIVQSQNPQIIYAMGVIGVLVRVEHGLDAVHFGLEQLLAQNAAGVDEYSGRLIAAFAPTLDQQ